MKILISEQTEAFKLLKDLKDSLVNTTLTKGSVRVRLDILDSYFARFHETHIKITRKVAAEDLKMSDISYFVKNTFNQYELLYFEVKGDLLDAYPDDTNPHNASTLQESPNQTKRDLVSDIDVRLPELQLNKFSGDYHQWISFRDLFVSMIHSQTRLSNSRKFDYLKGCLVGEALQLINHISISETNYDIAWKLLNERYHNTKYIIERYLKCLVDQPSMKRNEASEVRRILDTTKESMSILQSMSLPVDSWDTLVIFLIEQKFSIDVRLQWQRCIRHKKNLPDIDDMYDFLDESFRFMESAEGIKTKTHSEFQKQPQIQPGSSKLSRSTRSFHSNSDSPCPLCGKGHFLYKCEMFHSYDVAKRIEFVKSHSMCMNCLVIGHFIPNCKQRGRCHKCQRRHHTLLHLEGLSFSKPQTQQPSSNSCNTENKVVTFSHHGSRSVSSHIVLLATAIVKVVTPNGEYMLRALIDPGSQSSFITQDAVQNTGLPKINTNLFINGIGCSKVGSSQKMVHLQVTAQSNSLVTIQCQAFILPTLTSLLPKERLRPDQLASIPNVHLADPSYGTPGSIDLLLGADIYGNILVEGQLKLKDGPLLQNTIFGWIISGPVNASSSSSSFHFTDSILHTTVATLTAELNVDTLLRKFWEQEELSDTRSLSPEEESCEQHFINTHSRDESGRYIVALPFRSILNKTPMPSFNGSHRKAISRLLYLERILQKNPALRHDYVSFINEYEFLGHMSKVGNFSPENVSDDQYILPHHAVIKADSTTTKVRVVFDGSCKLPNGSSLNEELSPGPALQNDLAQTLLRFRRHRIAFSSDIEKMFRQILVVPEDQKYQKIIWRNSPHEPISEFKLNTVTYGTTCAPYLAIRAIKQLCKDEYSKFPIAAQILSTDIYVDDVLSGSDSINSAMQLQSELKELLTCGGFRLRKWVSNCSDILNAVPIEDREIHLPLDLNKDNSVKALGIVWHPISDEFTFSVKLPIISTATKRTLLSDTAKLFDPLGWISPIIVTAKILFQKLWVLGLQWDDPLPDSILNDWLTFRNNISSVACIRIPRWIGISTDILHLNIQGFSDASQAAYAAVVYSRIICRDGSITTHLLASKTKVAPVKQVSLPRLELCGAVLLAKLIRKIRESLNVSNCDVRAWTDSTIVLSWIRGLPNRWKTYVANRVSEIHSHTNVNQWSYVRSQDNPADCASRGVHPAELKLHPLWWNGPIWLSLSEENWPREEFLSTTTDLESKPSTTFTTTSQGYPEILLKYSTLTKLVRIYAFILRFVSNVRAIPTEREIHFIKTSEIKCSLISLIKLVQSIDFGNEISMLKQQKPINPKSPIISLTPFLDHYQILRVGGRLRNSKLPENTKHQILLTNSNPLTKLIIKDVHHRTLHGGAQLMQNFLRRDYWIIRARNIVKKTVHECITCFRYQRTYNVQLMGSLPSPRVTPHRPFLHSGVDYAGPLSIRSWKGRGAKSYKGYICLFICLVTKAIHLEAVSDCTSEGFIACFRRFTSRRGHCAELYSDCGTNFIGASTDLQLMYKKGLQTVPDTLLESLANNGTKWNFIPPASPHFGGLWEAGVKSTKHHLRRILKDQVLSFEELTTLLSEIESCLNSRPLVPLTEDIDDCNVLTPSHFLIGETSSNILDENLLESNINHISRWKRIQKLKQHFWHRWQVEFLTRMQTRPKWRLMQRNARIGDLVLIKDERYPPAKWPLARIINVHPGRDGIIRVITLQSNKKQFKRPIAKVCFLPLPDTEQLPTNS